MPGCGPTTATAGFWYDDSVIALPAHVAEKLGGLLTEAELESIKQLSRTEVERAFTGLNIRIVDDASAFWRVVVVRSLPAKGPLPNAGESMPLGFMGGSGAVSFDPRGHHGDAVTRRQARRVRPSSTGSAGASAASPPTSSPIRS